MCSEPKHHVNGNRTVEPFPEGTQMAVFGMGCFWGAERKFWVLKGVYSTQVGFAGGYTSNPTYKEVCSEKTGHAEVVRVVYQPEHISFEELLKVFWENHDPTQGMRQGNDHGTQYRSAIYPTSAKQMEAALSSKEDYQKIAVMKKLLCSSTYFEQSCSLPNAQKSLESHTTLL
uniref:peptide-methionine (S)-S-oxide reductase n=1 Tax=Macaca mulatta TaxID=9544 RepID=A0A5F7ZRY8_MACMU